MSVPPETLASVVGWSTLAANAVTVLGLPIAILLYYRDKRKERLEREYGTYNALDEKYLDYLKSCIEHPELDLYLVPLPRPLARANRPRTVEFEIRRLALFETLLSLFERAYLMYHGHEDAIRKKQWEGWSAYIKKWVKRAEFKDLFTRVDGSDFDKDFVTYLKASAESKGTTMAETAADVCAS